MSAHSLPINEDKALRNGFLTEQDPGASGTLPLMHKGRAIVNVVTAGAESRALPAASGYAVGTRLLVVFKTDGGDLTITGAATSVVLTSAGDVAEFVVSDNNGTKVWRRIDAQDPDLSAAARGMVTKTSAAVTDTATITAAQLLGGILTGVPVSAATYTLPTAALLVAAIPGAQVGDTFTFIVTNNGADADAITIAAGTGGTADGTLTVAQNVVRQFVVSITNVTAASEAYTVYGIG